MEPLLQSGQHPDADQLSAFMEKVLPEHERVEMLAHLAECGECRAIVFLAQNDLVPQRQAAVVREPWWRRLLHPAPVWAITFAGIFLVVASVGLYRVVERPKVADEAKNLPVAPVPREALEAPAKPRSMGRRFADGNAAPVVREKGKQVARKEAAPQAVERAEGGAAGGRIAGVLGGMGAGAGNAAPAAPVTQNSPSLPKEYRMAAPNRAAAASRSAVDKPVPHMAMGSNARAQVAVAEGPLRLTVEHGQGAQDGFTELRGTVRDGSGAVIPKASIRLRDLATGAEASAVSDAQGGFAIASLPAGRYEVRVSSMGFESLAQSIDLGAKDVAQIEPMLQVGSVAETVNVTAEALALNTESASVGSVVQEPERAALLSQVSLNGMLLELDTNGVLFRRGVKDKHWKKVKGKWHGAVTQLSVVADDSGAADAKKQAGEQGASEAQSTFVISVGSEGSWTSVDGRHWKRR